MSSWLASNYKLLRIGENNLPCRTIPYLAKCADRALPNRQRPIEFLLIHENRWITRSPVMANLATLSLILLMSATVWSDDSDEELRSVGHSQTRRIGECGGGF